MQGDSYSLPPILACSQIKALTESRVLVLVDWSVGLKVSSAYTVSPAAALWHANTSSMPFTPITASADTPMATHPVAAVSN